MNKSKQCIHCWPYLQTRGTRIFSALNQKSPKFPEGNIIAGGLGLYKSNVEFASNQIADLLKLPSQTQKRLRWGRGAKQTAGLENPHKKKTPIRPSLFVTKNPWT
jgi:hypothetical protein